MPSTPEPPARSRARTPPTPLHGPDHDNYHPYHSPRRSTRSTAQSNPYSSANSDRSPPRSALRHTTPPPTAKRARFSRNLTHLSSPPSSPASPARTRLAPQIHHKTPRKHLPTTATTSLPPASIDPTAMLPTPSKTPRKRNNAALNSTARILSFQPGDLNDVMPTRRQVRKHGRFNSANGFDLYSDDTRGETTVAVFTDANARVPEMDEGEDNPFVGPKSTATARPQRRSTRKTATAEDTAMEEAAKREEGMLFVFRGKKVFRRYSDGDSERSSTPGTDLGTDHEHAPAQRTIKRQAGAAAHRPLTRSSLKPRLLFPSEEEQRERERRAQEAEEEAATDIDVDIEMHDAALPTQDPKSKAADTLPHTPAKGRASKPFISPTTTRATRSGYIHSNATDPEASPVQATMTIYEDEPEPMSVGTEDSLNTQQPKTRSGKGVFDSWVRTKGGRKRAGDTLIGGEEAVGKRTRSAAGEGGV
ncbi:hypothetical protein LTR53_008020 [Teratosphaeriaceae sp. CCFEE 6253]|nr:hypothetical protein LTR53_008020 [Teratosphaeriaceae sp. CCFEE 6253]